MLNKRMLAGQIIIAGYTHAQVAKMLGISKNTFSARMNGRGFFDTDQVVKLCEILEITDPYEKERIFFAPNVP